MVMPASCLPLFAKSSLISDCRLITQKPLKQQRCTMMNRSLHSHPPLKLATVLLAVVLCTNSCHCFVIDPRCNGASRRPPMVQVKVPTGTLLPPLYPSTSPYYSAKNSKHDIHKQKGTLLLAFDVLSCDADPPVTEDTVATSRSNDETTTVYQALFDYVSLAYHSFAGDERSIFILFWILYSFFHKAD